MPFFMFRSVHRDKWSTTAEQNVFTSHSCYFGGCVGDFSEDSESCREMITVLSSSAQSCLNLGWPTCTYGSMPELWDPMHKQSINL